MQAWTNKPDLEDALLEMLSRYPRAKWIFTTRGSKGSILLEKVDLQNEHTGKSVRHLRYDTIAGSKHSES